MQSTVFESESESERMNSNQEERAGKCMKKVVKANQSRVKHTKRPDRSEKRTPLLLCCKGK